MTYMIYMFLSFLVITYDIFQVLFYAVLEYTLCEGSEKRLVVVYSVQEDQDREVRIKMLLLIVIIEQLSIFFGVLLIIFHYKYF